LTATAGGTEDRASDRGPDKAGGRLDVINGTCGLDGPKDRDAERSKRVDGRERKNLATS
jgi:hypothetical protein